MPISAGKASLIAAAYLSSPALAGLALILCAMATSSALPTFWTLPTAFLTGSAAAGGIALINSIGNLGGFVGPYAIGWIKDATGATTLGLVHSRPVTCWQARSPCCLGMIREWSWAQVLLRQNEKR